MRLLMLIVAIFVQANAQANVRANAQAKCIDDLVNVPSVGKYDPVQRLEFSNGQSLIGYSRKYHPGDYGSAISEQGFEIVDKEGQVLSSTVRKIVLDKFIPRMVGLKGYKSYYGRQGGNHVIRRFLSEDEKTVISVFGNEGVQFYSLANQETSLLPYPFTLERGEQITSIELKSISGQYVELEFSIHGDADYSVADGTSTWFTLRKVSARFDGETGKRLLGKEIKYPNGKRYYRHFDTGVYPNGSSGLPPQPER